MVKTALHSHLLHTNFTNVFLVHHHHQSLTLCEYMILRFSLGHAHINTRTVANMPRSSIHNLHTLCCYTAYMPTLLCTQHAHTHTPTPALANTKPYMHFYILFVVLTQESYDTLCIEHYCLKCQLQLLLQL